MIRCWPKAVAKVEEEVTEEEAAKVEVKAEEEGTEEAPEVGVTATAALREAERTAAMGSPRSEFPAPPPSREIPHTRAKANTRVTPSYPIASTTTSLAAARRCRCYKKTSNTIRNR